ncbi:MAG: hypothetical protein RL621_1085, partial [Bacteroidota bacterium]
SEENLGLDGRPGLCDIKPNATKTVISIKAENPILKFIVCLLISNF